MTNQTIEQSSREYDAWFAKQYPDKYDSWNEDIQRGSLDAWQARDTEVAALKAEIEQLKSSLTVRAACYVSANQMAESAFSQAITALSGEIERLKAGQPVQGEVMERVKRWLKCLSENESDPNEPIADNGGTVWQYYQYEAKGLLEALTTPPAAVKGGA